MEIRVLQKRFFNTAVADVLRAMDGRSLVGALALALCVIDYLAYMRKVASGNRDNYEAFVRDYLSRFEPRYRPEWVYALRCALVHTYAHADAMQRAGLAGYLFRHLRPEFHLSGNDKVLRLNVESFVTDIIRMAWEFFNGLPANPRDIEESGDKLLIIYQSNAEADNLYRNFHPALKELDADHPNFDNLQADIKAILEQAGDRV